MTTTLDGLRGAIAEMADGGATLNEIAAAIVDTAGLDSERRAALWLYARSCTTVAAAPSEAPGPVAAEGGRVHASGRPSEPGPAGKREGRDMPYVRCPNCGLTSYIVRNRWRAGECPGCGAELWAHRGERAVGSGGEGAADGSASGIAEALAVAREQLAMDLALLTQVEHGREIVRESAGEWPVVGTLDGRWLPVEETFCNRLLEGRISNRVPDAVNDDSVSDLGMAKQFGVGAWIGVPLELSDARLYMLCCLAREARPSLSDEDVRFLTGLGETVVAELEAAHG